MHDLSSYATVCLVWSPLFLHHRCTVVTQHLVDRYFATYPHFLWTRDGVVYCSNGYRYIFNRLHFWFNYLRYLKKALCLTCIVVFFKQLKLFWFLVATSKLVLDKWYYKKATNSIKCIYYHNMLEKSRYFYCLSLIYLMLLFVQSIIL